VALQIQPIFEAAAPAFGTGVNMDRFERSFLFALNLTLDELNVAGDMPTSSRFDHAASTDASVSGLNTEHMGIVFTGIEYHMSRLGFFARQDEDNKRNLLLEWEKAKGDFMVSLSQEDQDTVDSDDFVTNDIIGHGYIDV